MRREDHAGRGEDPGGEAPGYEVDARNITRPEKRVRGLRRREEERGQGEEGQCTPLQGQAQTRSYTYRRVQEREKPGDHEPDPE